MRKRSAAEPVRQTEDLPQVRTEAPAEPARPRLFNAVWVGNRVALLTRGDDNIVRKKEVPAEFSAFVPLPQFQAAEQKLRTANGIRGWTVEGDWVRIKFRGFHERRDACQPVHGLSPMQQLGLDTYEADLNPVKRWLIDNDVEIQKPRRAFCDIEIDSRVPFSEKSRARILCWSIVNEAGEKTLGMLEEDTDDAERELLEDFWHELQDYEQVSAWYGGDYKEDGAGFDFPVICSRTLRLGIRVDARRWLFVDQLEVFKKFNASSGESGDEKATMKLDAIAKKLLGEDEGKTEGVDGSMSWELWSAGGEDRRKLGLYCVNDTDLLRRIEVKTGFLELLDAMCQACGTFPDNYGAKGVNYVESFVMRLGRRRGHHFPSNWRNRGSTPFDGARVFEPTETGVLRNVHVCDFSGMYPSIIQTWNMSLETHAPELAHRVSTGGPAYLAHTKREAPALPPGHCRVPITGEVFTTGKKGILVEAIDAVRENRKKYDKLKASLTPGTDEWYAAGRAAQAAKIFVNTFYGVIGSTFSRLFRRAIGESVTQAGVWMIELVAREATARGMRFLYGDTDSGYVAGATEAEFRNFVNEMNTVVLPRELAALGCERNTISIAYEKEFETLILLPSKKRYAGKYRHYKGTFATADTKPEIVGLEYKRGDTARLCRVFQKRVIETLLSGDERLETYVAMVQEERDHILSGELERDDFVLSKNLSGAPDSYSTKEKRDGTRTEPPIHVRVAKLMQAKGMDVSEGTKISYVVTDASAKLVAVPIAEYVPGSEDRHYLWENLIYPATQRVLEACFKGHNWRLYEKTRPAKPRKGKPVPEEQAAFGFAHGTPGSHGITLDHESTKRREQVSNPNGSGGDRARRAAGDGTKVRKRGGTGSPSAAAPTVGACSDEAPEHRSPEQAGGPISAGETAAPIDARPGDAQPRRRSRSEAGGRPPF